MNNNLLKSRFFWCNVMVTISLPVVFFMFLKGDIETIVFQIFLGVLMAGGYGVWVYGPKSP